MSLLYSQSNKQVQLLRQDVSSFRDIVSTTTNVNANKSLSLLGSISTTITNVSRLLGDFESYMSNQTNADAQTKNRNRLAKLRGEYEELKKEFQSLKNKRQDMIKESELVKRESERNSLFTQTADDESVIGASASGVSDNPYSAGYRGKKHKDEENIDMMYEQQMKMERSNAKLDEILEMGRHAFTDIVEQNETILKAKEKMSESLLTLGVSHKTVLQIEKVMWEDKAIFYLGAFFTLLIMWLIWRYLG